MRIIPIEVHWGYQSNHKQVFVMIGVHVLTPKGLELVHYQLRNGKIIPLELYFTVEIQSNGYVKGKQTKNGRKDTQTQPNILSRYRQIIILSNLNS